MQSKPFLYYSFEYLPLQIILESRIYKPTLLFKKLYVKLCLCIEVETVKRKSFEDGENMYIVMHKRRLEIRSLV